MRSARWSVALAATVALGTTSVAPASASDDGEDKAGVGAPGVGDPYFPRAGNGGYDVAHYDLAIQYDPATRTLTGTTTITATATQSLRRFNLDLVRSLKVSELTVDGKPAKQARNHRELRVTPARTLKDGDKFTVVVTYGGTTHRPHDVTGSLFGWVSTKDGAFVANECDGAPTWFPSNDHPTDKATYDLAIRVPKGKTAISNGDLVGSTTDAAWTTWKWHAPDLMASYLVTATIGDFDITTDTGPHGLPILNAVDPDLGPRAGRALKQQPEILEFFEGIFGPYPFSSAGGIVDHAPRVGYALETQTRPLYNRPPGTGTVAHELSHQWFGDAVSLQRWNDMWLNEGFATYAEVLWGEHLGKESPQQVFDELYAIPAEDSFWLIAPGQPGVENLFSGPVYSRGFMTLQALRGKVGDDAFFKILRRWTAQHDDSDATTFDFITLAENVSGLQLDHFFDLWLYTPKKPVDW
jgi:aminopeptidase N